MKQLTIACMLILSGCSTFPQTLEQGDWITKCRLNSEIGEERETATDYERQFSPYDMMACIQRKFPECRWSKWEGQGRWYTMSTKVGRQMVDCRTPVKGAE